MEISNQTTNQKNEKIIRWLTACSVILILLLGAILRFYQLGQGGYGNEYYAATVKSMLTSWHNFFFVSFEPGGSVSVDKPPLGFWLEAASAAIFGLNGFAIALPNILAGILSIFLVFTLVKKTFGRIPALISALVLACIPITVVTERNNTIDGMLVGMLLLSTLAIWKAVEKQKAGFLYLGVVLLGLGFNIKMLQAFMVLPALYLLYFIGTKTRWWKRIAHLGLATLVLAAVSLSWALIVDIVPASQRPYVGSSTNNTVMELIFGHNGVERFTMSNGTGNNTGRQGGEPNGMPGGRPEGPEGQSRLGNPPLGNFLPGDSTQLNVPNPGGGIPGQMPGGMNPGGGQMQNTQPGLLRLFTVELGTQIGWLLPLALIGIALFLLSMKKNKPQKDQIHGVVFWSLWLLPMLGYFSFTRGIWHSYYLIMLGPAIAALVGVVFWGMIQLQKSKVLPAKIALTGLSGSTVAYAIYLLLTYASFFKPFAIGLALVWFVLMGIYWIKPRSWSLFLMGMVCVLAPLYWTVLTVQNPDSDQNLPSAVPAITRKERTAQNTLISTREEKLINYLLAHYDHETYLVATATAQKAIPFVLGTNDPVLTFGGFLGSDRVVSLSELESLVKTDKLRFVLASGDTNEKKQLYTWVADQCAVVTVPGYESTATQFQAGGGPGFTENTVLYDCAKAK